MYTNRNAKKKLRLKELKWPVTIYFDDREKKGVWHIDHDKFRFVRRRLAVGDYTIKGFEDIVTVERKAGWHEIIGNITGKKRSKFENYLNKLAKYPIPVFVVEDELGNVPRALKRLKYSALREETIFHWVNKIRFQLGITLICADFSKISREEFLYYMFENILERISKDGYTG